jgi:hypothetical protein
MSNVGTAPKPSYSYTALPKENVKAAITGDCGAGATLDITLTGAIPVARTQQSPPSLRRSFQLRRNSTVVYNHKKQ